MLKAQRILVSLLLVVCANSFAQQSPGTQNDMLYQIIDEVQADRLESDITKLVSFGTRHTLSDTVSKTRGIGAARRCIKSEFDKINTNCNNCLEVRYVRTLVKGDPKTRIPMDTYVVSVIAIQKGNSKSNAYIAMAGDIDSRVSDILNFTDDSPGANDNATGVAGVIESARVLSRYKFENNIIYMAISGEEQGLYGGQHIAEEIKSLGWDMIGVFNNDMIGNIEGIDGVIDNREFRIFSEPTPVDETDRNRRMRRFYGGEVDGVSRQLARYVYTTTSQYLPELKPILIYRLDRFGRGGHHRPFNDAGFAGLRIMEAHENYNRQHQDIRTENGIEYGDVLSGVDFDYTAQLTRVNAISMARLASAPAAPKTVSVGGAVEPDTVLKWEKSTSENVLGYYVYWRATTADNWEHRIFVKLNEHTLKGWVIDNYLFGVSAVNSSGDESVVVFPSKVIR
jgi:hypothetical protein